MAQTVSDEELQAKRDRVAKLREQLANEEAKASVRVREQENAIEAAQLDAEEARLQLQLHNAKEGAKVASVKQGVEPVLTSAKEQMRLAEAQLKAAQGEGAPGAPKDPAPEESSTTAKATEKAATDKDKE